MWSEQNLNLVTRDKVPIHLEQVPDRWELPRCVILFTSVIGNKLKWISFYSLGEYWATLHYFSWILLLQTGERPLPAARLDEIIYVLQELARLKIHCDTASVLPLPSHLNIVSNKENHDRRPHLLILFPSFCELVISR